MAPVKLTLSGTGDIHREPERAVVTVTVQSSGPDRAAVSDKVQQTARSIQATVRSLAARDAVGAATVETAIMRWSSSGMATRTWKELYYETEAKAGSAEEDNDNNNNSSDGNGNGNGSKKRKRTRRQKSRQVYEATISITTRFRDFDRLSSFTVDLASVPLVSVGNIGWVLTTETQDGLLVEATQKAYLNALTKARAYADAMGLGTVRPVKIDEPQTYGSGMGYSGMYQQQQQQQYRQVQAPRASSASDSSALSCVPQDVVYKTMCNVEFEIE